MKEIGRRDIVSPGNDVRRREPLCTMSFLDRPGYSRNTFLGVSGKRKAMGMVQRKVRVRVLRSQKIRGF